MTDTTLDPKTQNDLDNEFSDTEDADLAAEALAEAENGLTGTSAAKTPAAGSSSTQAKPTGQELAETLSALQNIIERNASELDRIKAELSELKEGITNVMDNDTELAAATEKVQEVTQEVKQRRTAVMGSAQVIQLKSKINDLNEQKKEIEEALNNHLLNLYHVTGSKTYDTADGQQREFNIRASLKSAKPKKE